ncbi:MAG TPA: GNAT family N-acetyltransferase [Acidimicrobiia bacterium]
MSGITVRRATTADTDAAAFVLADAFTDYAWTRWTVDAVDHVERVRSLQRLVIEKVALPYGQVWVALDEHDAVASVAVWMLPTITVPEAVLTEIGGEQAALEGGRHAASVAAELALSQSRPQAAHYYLGTVGTRRDRQGRGYGAAVLAPIVERARAEHAALYLETSAPDNVRFYTRLGFEIAAELDVPGGGPHVWAMRGVDATEAGPSRLT